MTNAHFPASLIAHLDGADYTNPPGWKAPENMHMMKLSYMETECGVERQVIEKRNAFVTSRLQNVTCLRCIEALKKKYASWPN